MNDPTTKAAEPRIFSGRSFSTTDFDTIRRLISDHPKATRSKLSHLVCQILDWRKPDGGLKAMRCRVVMLRMHEQGLIQLPGTRQRLWSMNGGRTLRNLDPDTLPQPAISDPVHCLLPLRIDRIEAKDAAASRRCNTFIHRYHYLGYQQTPGSNLRYRVTMADGRELAYLIWASAAWKTAPRDRWIGWTEAQRREKLHLIVNNTRFLILPWVRSPNLASYLLAIFCRRLPNDWQERYGYRPVLAETFVDTTRYTGHCYLASNWTNLGQTTGRSKWDRYSNISVPKKDLWVYPLVKSPTRFLH
jgi:hypothetical protein